MIFTATLENVQILEKVSEDTLVFLQTHKRIWPASQRDALFWSHMKKVEEDLDSETKDMWIVCNHSTLNPDYPRKFHTKIHLINSNLLSLFIILQLQIKGIVFEFSSQ